MKPCKECPFVKTSMKGWLGPWKDASELHRFVMSENGLACHMTVSEDEVEDDNVSHCVGSILYMNKNAKKCSANSELGKLQENMKHSDKSDIMNVPEFFDHHDMKNWKRK